MCRFEGKFKQNVTLSEFFLCMHCYCGVFGRGPFGRGKCFHLPLPNGKVQPADIVFKTYINKKQIAFRNIYSMANKTRKLNTNHFL